MSPLSILLNLLWIVFGGLEMAIGWLIAAVIMAITIIGIPWARAAFNIAAYTLLPFGQRAVSRADHLGQHDVGTGPFGFIGNIIWLILAGWWLALAHLIEAILVIGNPSDEVLPVDSLRAEYGRHAGKVSFVDGRQWVPPKFSGWWSQQILKLLIAFGLPASIAGHSSTTVASSPVRSA